MNGASPVIAREGWPASPHNGRTKLLPSEQLDELQEHGWTTVRRESLPAAVSRLKYGRFVRGRQVQSELSQKADAV